jgi:hypothetical protein
MSRGLLTPKKSAVQGWCDRGAREEGEHLAEAEEAIHAEHTKTKESTPLIRCRSFQLSGGQQRPSPEVHSTLHPTATILPEPESCQREPNLEVNCTL